MNATAPAPAPYPLLPKWSVRVALTDGGSERQLLDIFARPTGVHATVAGHDLHTSHHIDGWRHVTGPPTRDDYGRRLYPPAKRTPDTRLAQLTDARVLLVVDLHNVPLHFGQDSAFPALGGGTRQVWRLDTHQFTPNARHQVRAGVVGSGGPAALNQYIADATRDGSWVLAYFAIGAGSPGLSPFLVVLCSTLPSPPGSEEWAWSSDADTICDGQPMTFYPPPNLRGPRGQPKRKPVVWPPKPCAHSAAVTFEYGPDSVPFITVPGTGEMRLAVSGVDPGNPCLFGLCINARFGSIDDQGNVRMSFPPMRPAEIHRMAYGRAGNAECTYVSEDGRIFYVRCRNLEWKRVGEGNVSTYHLEVQWNDSWGSPQASNSGVIA
jgi:hypothetical protein